MGADGRSFFQQLPWEKMTIWALFLVLVYLVRDFFAIIFLTFIFSYIANNVVNTLGGRPGTGRAWRWVRKPVILVAYAIFVLLGSGLVWFLLPNLMDQGRALVAQLQRINPAEVGPELLRGTVGRFRYRSYEGTPEYAADLADFRQERGQFERATWEQFHTSLERIRGRFVDTLLDREYAEYSRTLAYRSDFESFVSERAATVYGVEVQRYNEEYDADLREFNPALYERLRETEGYRVDREAAILQRIESELVVDEAIRAEFENRWRQRRADDERDPLLEHPAEFEAFYTEAADRQVQGAALGIVYDYATFVGLADAARADDREQFAALLGRDDEKVIAAFRAEAEERFADEIGVYVDPLLESVTEYFPKAVSLVGTAVAGMLTFSLNLVLAMLFSLILVWDLPRIGRAVRKLEHSSVERFYREIAPGMVNLAGLIGRAFMAQAVIAIVNTGLTFLALYFLDIPKPLFLSTIVFICSFIPVAGVFISSVPIVLVCLLESGILLALQAVAAILLIHFIEAWILNPKIVGDILKLHPILVIAVLTLGQSFFGVWGLLLGVPVAVYVIRHVIFRGEEEAESAPARTAARIEEVAS